MYRTGDLGRWFPDGTIEFIGRKDHQVKIRGYRIELGEIEFQIQKIDSIKSSTVIVRKDALGNDQLVAYVITKEVDLNVDAIREQLLGSLPEYMVPQFYVKIEAFPLTISGKIDSVSIMLDIS